MPSTHAKLSASGSSRWLNCTASVQACDSIKTDMQASSSNAAAEEGSCAHELADICLRAGSDPSEYLGQTLNDAPLVTVDAEMVRYVRDYVEYCRSYGGDAYPEELVKFDEYVPEGFGTSDFITFNGNVCTIVDLKYGRGEVSAVENTQAKLYALGVLQEFGFMYEIERFDLCIYQPRIGNVSEWSINTEDLVSWGDGVVKPKATEAFYGNGVFSPGEKQCQWCPYKPHCTSLLNYCADQVGADFGELNDSDDLLSVESLPLETAANVLRNKTLITSWLTAIEGRVHESLVTGVNVPGYKLVSGRGSRKWLDESEVETRLSDLLGDSLFEKKLLSAPKLEKLIGKSEFKELAGDLVVKAPGKATVVPESDKRPDIRESAIEDIRNGF